MLVFLNPTVSFLLSSKMNILLVIFCFTGIFSFAESKGNSPPSKDWESYKAFYNKFYVNSVAETKHQENFKQNVKRVETHNAKYDEGKVPYSLELNQYSDQDPKTFSATRNGYVQMNDFLNETKAAPTRSNISAQAANFDWRSQKKVSPVKNQGGCGSCWAFSAVGALESQILMAGKNLQTLSEEQLVDCDKSNKGCGGGHYLRTWDYIKQSGIQSDSVYPYTARNGNGGTCKYDSSKIVLRVRGSKRVSNDAGKIMETLRSAGPLSAAMDASKLQHYSDGIFTCTNPSLNHAVLIVGYGSENGQDYWLVKNSWGSGWGNKGYVKISRRSGSDCGLTRDVAYATI